MYFSVPYIFFKVIIKINKGFSGLELHILVQLQFVDFFLHNYQFKKIQYNEL